MQLYHWRGARSNFGDELNLLLWPRLLPKFFDGDPSALFLGIGSVLDARHAPDVLKCVAGAGYGGYQPPPSLDARWVIHWVRGPRTTRQLGLDPELGLGDPAMLLPKAGWTLADGDRRGIGFMPHFESQERGAWSAAATAARVTLIDPSGDPAAALQQIASCRLVLSEALHGVIVADALRVPWVALQPLAAIHRAKWHDWADALGVSLRQRQLAPSSLLERLQTLPFAGLRTGRRLLKTTSGSLAWLARRRFIEQAAQSLLLAASAEPQLSAAAALDRSQTRMLERLEAVRRHPASV